MDINIVELVDGKGVALQKEQEQLQFLEERIEDGEIKVKRVDYTAPNEPPILDAAASNPSVSRDNESQNHVRLKAIASQYLSGTGSDPVFEQETWFGIADVGNADKTRFAEAGQVRVGKLVEAFGWESQLPLLGETNPAYEVADELLYVPYTGNEEYPPVTILVLSSTNSNGD